MFIRKKFLFMGILMLCVVGVGGFCPTAGAGESESKKGEAEITWLHPPKYYNGTAFSEGRAWVQEEEDGPWSLLDDQGNVLKTGFKAFDISSYQDGIASFWPSLLPGDGDDYSRRGFLNRSGDVALSPNLCEGVCRPYSEGLITRKDKKGLCGFIDLSGKWVIPPAYDVAYFFIEGLAPVRKGDKSGFIDKKGTVVIDFKFDGAYFFSHKMAPVRAGSKWGVIDTKGRWIAKPVYDGIGGDFWSDPIALEKDGKVGFINSKGDVVIDFQYLPALRKEFSLYCFNKDRAIVLLDYKYEKYWEYGIIDESGKVLFQRKNCEFFFVGDYILCVDEDERLSLIDRKNREYDLPADIQFSNEWAGPNRKSSNLFMGRRDGKIGYFTIALKDD